MSNVFFISDLHFGHNKILKFSGEYRLGATIEEHDEWLINSINSVVSKRDKLFILGDVAFGQEHIKKLGRLAGVKELILGNHDKYRTQDYLRWCTKIHGFRTYNGFWLSHAPIHPAELRGCFNIHGHVHMNSLPDRHYLNVSVEACAGHPVPLELLKEMRLEVLEHEYETKPIQP